MRILSLETSTKIGGVSLFENDQLIDVKSSDNQKSHSDFIHKAIEDILKKNSLQISDIDVFASGLGPGSFTGIRIAVSAVKTFSYILKKPIVAENSLRLLAEQVSDRSIPALTIINAYKNMNYTALYSFQKTKWICLAEPQAVQVLDLNSWVSEKIETHCGSSTQSFSVVGDGYTTYEKFYPTDLQKKWIRPDNPQDYPLSQTLAKLAYEKIKLNETIDWNLLKPLYIRASEAEENHRGVKFTPLK